MTLTAQEILTWFVPGASSASGGWKKPSPPNAGAVILQQFVRAAITLVRLREANRIHVYFTMSGYRHCRTNERRNQLARETTP
jgi:hypothetical protein